MPYPEGMTPDSAMLRPLAFLALAASLSFPALATASPGAAPPDTVDVARYATLSEAVAAEVVREAKLVADDADIGDFFGGAVSLDGNRALIGADRAGVAGANSGAAYVFAYDAARPLGLRWHLEGKLIADDPSSVSFFGDAVSIQGSRALIEGGGEVYVFAFDGSRPVGQQWVQQAKLSVDDVGVTSVSLEGDLALLGASVVSNLSGAAYVFAFDGAQPPGQQWSQQAVLTAEDAADNDRFGGSVSLSGGRALVGARGDLVSGPGDSFCGAGAAYVFAFDGTAWAQEAKLTAADADPDKCFGRSVSLDGDRALIGAPRDVKCGFDGAAYVFSFDGARPPELRWSQTAKLVPSDVDCFDMVGESVSLDGNHALLGTDPDSDGCAFFACGKAYLFAFDGATWDHEATLTATSGTVNDMFGTAVSLSGYRALVGARLDDDGGKDAGAAYIFDLETSTLPVADAGPDQTAVAGQTVTLDGTGSTGDGPLSFAWTLTGAALSDADAAMPSFCASAPGAYVAELAVTDAAGATASDAVTVTALSASDALGALVGDVLATDGLSRGQARLLVAELKKAQRALARGADPTPFLDAFRDQVLGFESQGVLTAAAAGALVSPGDAVASALASPCSQDGAPALASATAETADAWLTAYPNPSGGRATVAFSVDAAGPVRLSVHDALGREVAVLVDGALAEGRHVTVLDASALPAGVYLVRLAADGQAATQRITRLR